MLRIAEAEFAPSIESPHAAPAIASRWVIWAMLLVIAVGAALRFYRLGADEISRGEAAAWSAAAAPTLQAVYAASARLDPGKSGIYDLALHLWILAFGDGVAAMRALSAACGTLTIALLFFAVRELIITLDDHPDAGFATLAGVLAALFYAINLRMITTDRTARMYALMLAAVFAQLWCFSRAHRRDARPRTIIAGALATDLATACNFTILFFFAAEFLWLLYLWFFRGEGRQESRLSVLRPMSLLILAGFLFLPIALPDAAIALTSLHGGILGTIEPQAPWWPLRAIQVMTGNAAFWTTLALAAFALWRGFSRASLALRFVIFWLIAPFVIIEVISYLITPLMVERYLLAGLIAWLTLAAIGAAGLPFRALRYAAVALILGQSIAHIHHHWRAPDDVQWREAARLAVASSPPHATIAVIPTEPIIALSYYLSPADGHRLIRADAVLDQHRVWQMRCGAEPLLIDSTELPAAAFPAIKACYPHVLRRFRLVEVRSK